MGTVEEQPETSKLEKMIGLIKDMRIEPFLFVFMLGITVREVTLQSVLMHKACTLNLEQPQDVCSNLDYHPNVKEEVQRIALHYRIGMMLIAFLPSVVTTTFLTPWSEKYGRKFPMLAAIFGVILEGIGSTIVASSPSAPLFLFLCTQIPYGMSGGVMLPISSTFTYIADVATPESRSIKYAFLQFAFIISEPTGLEVGGRLYKHFGGVSVFVTTVVAHAISFAWILFIVKETRGKNEKKNLREMIKQLFSMENLKTSIRTCTMKRPGTIRAQIWLLILALSVAFYGTMSTGVIGFLYANRMYNWDNPKYSTITAIITFIRGLSMLIVIPIFTKVLNMPDSMIGLIGMLSYLAECGIKVMAYKEWMYFLANILGLLVGISSVAGRELISKMVAQDELSNVFALLAFCESVTPLISIGTFGPLYAATLAYFPGSPYLLITCLLIICSGIFIWIHKQGPAVPKGSETNQGEYVMDNFNEKK